MQNIRCIKSRQKYQFLASFRQLPASKLVALVISGHPIVRLSMFCEPIFYALSYKQTLVTLVTSL